MPPVSHQDISSLLLESLNQILSTAVSHRRNGNELEDSTMSAFVDQLNLSEMEIYDGLKDMRKRAHSSVSNRASDVRKQETAQAHLAVADNFRQVLEEGITPNFSEDTFFIKHPLGKQEWPEFVLYHRGKVLPIEVKSGAEGKIVWNGGLPRPGCLYVYYYTKNRAEGRRATIFFGEDLITPQVYQKLRENHEKVQAFAKSIHAQTFTEKEDSMGFSEYARAMYNHDVRIHQHPKSSLWQANTRVKIAEWSDAHPKVLEGLKALRDFEEEAYLRKMQEAATNEASKETGVSPVMPARSRRKP
jgi:hypothetical protein